MSEPKGAAAIGAAKPITDPLPLPLPVEVANAEPLKVELAAESVAALSGAPVAASNVATLGGEPVIVAPQATTTTETKATTIPVPVMPPTVTKLEGVTLPPTTTEEQDITTKGQRRVSLLWESIQGFISVTITLAVIYCQIKGITSETLNNAFFFVVATYLQRTNHIRVGGVGVKPYEGR